MAEANQKLSTEPPRNLSRSITVKPSSTTTDDEFTKKSLYDTIALQRAGSIKTIYSVISSANSLRGKVRKLCSIFESPKTPAKLQALPPPPPPATSWASKNAPSPVPFRLPGTEDRVVIYTTSLRSIRKTFQDCHVVRMIFKGLRVNLEERDVSMDSSYRKELERALGESNVTLPRVFLKGKYIGGADVVRQLHEAGELVRLLDGMAKMRDFGPCIACDDVRFVPCGNCNGSRKVFDEERTKRCPDCNENGLVHCPLCS